MGHGTPDWWGSEPGETTFQVQDVGELAARLGSVDLHDRRGNVVFIDSFEGGLSPYSIAAIGTGSRVVLSAVTSRHGAYSCKLTTGAEAGASAHVRRIQPYPVLSKYGVEIAFTGDNNAVEIGFEIELYDGTNLTRFTIKYLPATDKWQYEDAAGAWQNLVTGVALAAGVKPFHIAKLAVDLETGKYYYFLYNEFEVSMAGIAGYKVANAFSPKIQARAVLVGGAGAAATIYVDDMIITQNEP